MVLAGFPVALVFTQKARREPGQRKLSAVATGLILLACVLFFLSFLGFL